MILQVRLKLIGLRLCGFGGFWELEFRAAKPLLQFRVRILRSRV